MEKYGANLKEKTFIFKETKEGGFNKLCSEKDTTIEEFKKGKKCKASIINTVQNNGLLIIIETIFYEE